MDLNHDNISTESTTVMISGRRKNEITIRITHEVISHLRMYRIDYSKIRDYYN